MYSQQIHMCVEFEVFNTILSGFIDRNIMSSIIANMAVKLPYGAHDLH